MNGEAYAYGSLAFEELDLAYVGVIDGLQESLLQNLLKRGIRCRLHASGTNGFRPPDPNLTDQVFYELLHRSVRAVAVPALKHLLRMNCDSRLSQWKLPSHIRAGAARGNDCFMSACVDPLVG